MKKSKLWKHGLHFFAALAAVAVVLMCFPVEGIYGKTRNKEKADSKAETVVIAELETPAADSPVAEETVAVAEVAKETEETESVAESNDTQLFDATEPDAEEYRITEDLSADLTVQTDGGTAGEVSDYYNANSKVISITYASKSKTAPTEKQVAELLKARGFSADNVTYEFLMGGQYVGETAITGDSKAIRPMYQTDYYSAAGELWTIFVINGKVFANPVSYNIQSDRPVQLLISETNELTSYDYTGDRYFVTIPKDSAVIVKTVDKITAETLDKITCGDIDGL